MILNLNRVTGTFKFDEMYIGKSGDLCIDSPALAAHICKLEEALAAAAVPTIAEPESPPAPVEVEYEDVPAKLGNYTSEQYRTSGWSTEQLLARGFIRVVEEAPVAPPVVEEAPALPDAPSEPDMIMFKDCGYKMSAKAQGNTLDDFKSKGWDEAMLIRDGYLEEIPGTAPTAPEALWPKKVNGDWVDSAGTTFDVYLHGVAKATGDPAVTAKGVFKKSRKKVPTIVDDPVIEEAPAAPAPELDDGTPDAPPGFEATKAAVASKVEAVPSAPEAPILGADEPLDDELSAMIKDWA